MCAPVFTPTWQSRAKLASAGKEWVDCNPLGVNKGSAIRFLQEYLGIAPDETCTFGDNLNDIEMLLSVDELFEAAKTGALEEAWCIGTAAVISPIGALGWGDKCYEINHNRIGELSQKLYDELTGIQWGTKPDPFGWTCPVC